MQKLIFFLILGFYTLSLGAKETTYIGCAHVQICNILSELLADAKSEGPIELKMPFQPVGDPHHYEPGPGVIKELLQIEHLITPPTPLSPWLSKILNKRNQNEQTKTYELELNKLVSPEFVEKNTEARSHFWLHPKSLCLAKQLIQKELLKWNPQLSSSKPITCLSRSFRLFEIKLKKLYQDIPIILYHDALAPYFEELKLNVFALRGSGHGEQLSPKSLKELHQFLKKHPSALWLEESSIMMSSQLKSLVRKQDLRLRVDTLGKSSTPPEKTLLTLLQDLVATAQKKKALP